MGRKIQDKPQTPVGGRVGRNTYGEWGRVGRKQKEGMESILRIGIRAVFYAENSPRIKVALVLPKPKELERTIFTPTFLATLGT